MTIGAARGRWLVDPDELVLLEQFNARAVVAAGQAGYIHPGDIVHRIFNGNRHFDKSRLLHVWEDATGIAAWTLLQPKHAGFDLQVRPDVRGGAFERELLAWCEVALRERLGDLNRTVDELVIDAYTDDPARIEAAEALGWSRGSDPYFVTTRPTEPEINAPVPDGYTVRTVGGIAEAAAIGELHSAAFGSTWNPGEYATLMGTYGYSPDREWLVVAPNGALAGFTETWHDPITGIGLFEPVGVHPDHRRRGIGRVLMAAGLRHMRAAGLETGMVCFAGDNPASRALYLGCGFEIAHEIIDYTKPVTAA